MPFIKRIRKGGAVTPQPPAPDNATSTAAARRRPSPQTTDDDALDGDVLSPGQGADIPPHVWALLQAAGETAAARLVEVLQSPRFTSYAPSAQRGLIELALTRAYGLPIRTALNLNLSSTAADAVAASLSDLGNALPEHLRHTMRDASPAARPTRAGETQPNLFRVSAPPEPDSGL